MDSGFAMVSKRIIVLIYVDAFSKKRSLINYILKQCCILQTLEKDGLQSTRMFKRIHKRGTRNSSLCEETPAEFHRSLSEAHISEVKL